MITDTDILSLYHERRTVNAHVLQTGALITRIVNGDFTLTLPELEKQELNAVVNLIAEGVDAYGQRIASVEPLVQFPPATDSTLQRKRANDKALVIKGWWHLNRMPLLRRKRARHLIGLATSPVYIRPGPGYPIWEVREPLSTFPSPGDPLNPTPDNCIFSFRRTYGQLRAQYPEAMAGYVLPKGETPAQDMKIDILQYCDADEFVMLATGRTETVEGWGPWTSTLEGTVTLRLQRVPNIAGAPMVVVPGRITMGRLQGQFDQLIGMYESQGTLWAMHLHALKRAIFPETWLVGNRPQEDPQIVTPADPYLGQLGVVTGGVITDVRSDPSVQTLQTMNAQERNQRLVGGIPAELGGESASNIRTARRGSQVLSSAIDFSIQEHQQIFEISHEAENRAAIATARAYWPSKSRTLIVPFSDLGVTYTPSETFGDIQDDFTDGHLVSYAFPGADTAQLVVEAGQRKGMGTLPTESFMEIDPLVRDPVRERRRINGEALEMAYLSNVQQQAANPQGPYQPIDVARLIELVKVEGKEPYEAEVILQKEIQKRQQAAATGQLPPEELQPGNTIPGAPGTPQAAQPVSGVPGANPDQAALAKLMMNLRGVNRGVAPMAPNAQ